MNLVPKFLKNMLKILMSDFYSEINSKYYLNSFYHMTRIANISGMIGANEIKAKNRIDEDQYKKMSNDDVQSIRAKKIVFGLSLHDYVPLYIGFKTPMVAVNKHQNEDFVFMRFSLEILKIPGSVIADGNAATSSTKFIQFKNIEDLACLDITTIRGVKYAGDQELRRKKQAEILVPNGLSLAYLLDIVCYSESAEKRVLSIFHNSGKLTPYTWVGKGWYFPPEIS